MKQFGDKESLLSDIQSLMSSFTKGELSELSLYSDDDGLNLIAQLTKRSDLENFGRNISGRQFLNILNHTSTFKLEEKIPPLFVGMRQEVFDEMLVMASDAQIKMLKSEGLSESICHHLFLLTHQLDEDSCKFFHILNVIESHIHLIDPDVTTKEEVIWLRLCLEECVKFIDLAMQKIQKSLIIAWSCGNLDLIDQFNNYNQNLQKVKNEIIGHQDLACSGLYGLLMGKLYPKPLHDEDPSLEGLAAFSVWYLEDYQDVGLLSKETQLSLNKERQSEEESIKYREKLFELVKDNLNKINLRTVSDLKKHGIFSRSTLKDFISKHL